MLKAQSDPVSDEESNYDPISVEAAVDDAYTIAGYLNNYREEVEEAIGMVEKMPYSVNEDGDYSQDELIEASNGFNMLENIHARVSGSYFVDFEESRDEWDAGAVKLIERVLKEQAFDPAMDEGDILYPDEE